MNEDDKYENVKAPIELWILRESMQDMTFAIKGLQDEVRELKEDIDNLKKKDNSGFMIISVVIFIFGMIMMHSAINGIPFKVMQAFCHQTPLGPYFCQ